MFYLALMTLHVAVFRKHCVLFLRTIHIIFLGFKDRMEELRGLDNVKFARRDTNCFHVAVTTLKFQEEHLFS